MAFIVYSYIMLTKLNGKLHNRMPVLVNEKKIIEWLESMKNILNLSASQSERYGIVYYPTKWNTSYGSFELSEVQYYYMIQIIVLTIMYTSETQIVRRREISLTITGQTSRSFRASVDSISAFD